METTVEQQDSREQPARIGISSLEELLMMTLLDNQVYGWQIVKAIKEVSGGTLLIGAGSLYPTLQRLEKVKGLVESRWGDDKPEEQRGARKRYYNLTELGVSALKEAQQLRYNLMAWQPT